MTSPIRGIQPGIRTTTYFRRRQAAWFTSRDRVLALRVRLSRFPSLKVVALSMTLLVAACTDRVIEPRPPEPAAVAVTIVPAAAAEELRAAFGQAQQVRIHLARESAPEVVRVIEKPAAAELRLSLSAEMTRAREVAHLAVELLYNGAVLFRGGGEIVLNAGETTAVQLAVAPVPARVAIKRPVPPITSLGDTLQLTGAVVLAQGNAIPGLALTWRVLDDGLLEGGANGRLVAIAEGEARVEGSYGELADTVRVEVKAIVASLDVEPIASTLRVGETVQLRAVLRDRRGNALDVLDAGGAPISSRQIRWISSRPGVAQVDAQSGLVSALAPDTVTVTAFTDEGKSGTARLTITALPPLVTECAASQIGATAATLTCRVDPNQAETSVAFAWDRSASLGNRTPIRSVGSGSSGQGMSETLTNLSPRTEYFWRIEASNSGGETHGVVLSFTTADAAPVAPGSLTATAAGLQINLAWSDRSDNESEFRIERKAAAAASWSEIASVAAGSTAYTDAGLSVGITYFYRVRAWNSAGFSSYSNEAQATASVAPGTTTSAATNLSASAATLHGSVIPNGAATQAWFEWGASSSLATRDSTTKQSVGAGTSAAAVTATLTTLSPGTTYYYRVAARNASGSALAEIQTFTTPPAAPAAPSNLAAAAASAAEIRLTWQDKSDDEQGFRIERRVAGGSFAEIATVAANVTAYQDQTVQAGTSYTYRVRAQNAGGNSSYSNEARATTPSSPPLMITLVDDFAGSAINLQKWIPYQEPLRVQQDDRLTVNLTPNVAGYGGLMYRLPHTLLGSSFYAEISEVAAGGPNTETFVGISSLDEEEYVLITSFGGRISAWRKWRGESYFRVGAEIAYHPANHRFRRIREQGGITYLEVSADGTTWAQPASGWSIAHRFSAPENLHGLVGAGAFWPDASAGTAIFENVNTTVPAIPRSLSATPEAARISLAWQDRSVNEAGFRIERRATNGSFSEIASVGANISEYRDNAVQPGVTYEYRVRAFNASGQSSYSNRAAATIP